MCPYLLEANLALVMIFDQIINSLFVRESFNATTISPIKYLQKLKLNTYYESLNGDMLNVDLFRLVEVVEIRGVLNRIEQLQLLNSLNLNLSNFKEFFHSDLNWMTDLNANSKTKQIFLIYFVYPKEKRELRSHLHVSRAGYLSI